MNASKCINHYFLAIILIAIQFMFSIDGFSAHSNSYLSHHKICSKEKSSLIQSHLEAAKTPITCNYFATCIPGLSQSLAYEIQTILPDIPVENIQIQGPSGVSFVTNSPKDGLKALYWLRTAHRLLELICTNDRQHPKYDDGQSIDDDSYEYSSNSILDRHDLYDFIRNSCNVQALLGDGKGGILNLSCKCLSSSSSSSNLPQDLRHLHYTALTIKNALVDECRDLHPQQLRPDVNTVDPDVPLFLAIQNSPNQNKNRVSGGVTVSLYRCLNNYKISLHKRGYRSNDVIHKAAMKESLAAGLLYASGYDKLIRSTQKGEGKAVLLDPMMGSATFLIEAAYLASDVAPGLLREKFNYNDYEQEKDINIVVPPVLRWKDTNVNEWQEVRQEAKQRAMKGRKWLLDSCQNGDVILQGNEMDPRAFHLAKRCLSRGGLDQMVSITNSDCIDWVNVKSNVVQGRSMVVTNPQWGLRLNQSNNDNHADDDTEQHSYITDSWNSLGVFLKRECSGVEAWILSGNKNLTKLLKMKKTRGIPIQTGEEDLRWIQYHIFDWKRDGSYGKTGTSARVENDKIQKAKLTYNNSS